jgi:hypothetical protein
MDLSLNNQQPDEQMRESLNQSQSPLQPAQARVNLGTNFRHHFLLFSWM